MAQLSGRITITTAGTAIQGPNVAGSLFFLWAAHDNTGDYCFVGNDGADDVSSTTGAPMKKDLNPTPLAVNNLNEAWFDSDTSGDEIAWLLVDDGSG